MNVIERNDTQLLLLTTNLKILWYCKRLADFYITIYVPSVNSNTFHCSTIFPLLLRRASFYEE
jgi:hypothetical protein